MSKFDSKAMATRQLADVLWDTAKQWQDYKLVDQGIPDKIKELASEIHLIVAASEKNDDAETH